MRRLLFILALSLQFVFSQRVLAQVSDDPSPDDFVDVEKEPEPIIPIEKLIIYPEIAKRSGLEGKVTIEALIEKDGSVSKVVVVKSAYDVFRDEAIRAMKSAKFTPAMQKGAPVRVWVTRTINFKLTTPKTHSDVSSDYSEFRAVMGVSLDSARALLGMIGKVSETKAGVNTILQASNDSASAAKVNGPVMNAKAIVGPHGVTEMTIVFFHSAAEYAAQYGSSNEGVRDVDLDDVTVHVTLDPKAGTMTVQARKK